MVCGHAVGVTAEIRNTPSEFSGICLLDCYDIPRSDLSSIVLFLEKRCGIIALI